MFGWGPQKDSPTRAKEMTVEKEDDSNAGAWAPPKASQKSKSVNDEIKDTAQRR